MLDRLWWFVTGTLAGGFVTVRALRRKPARMDLKEAAVHTGADLMNLTAKVIRPRPRH